MIAEKSDVQMVAGQNGDQAMSPAKIIFYAVFYALLTFSGTLADDGFTSAAIFSDIAKDIKIFAYSLFSLFTGFAQSFNVFVERV